MLRRGSSCASVSLCCRTCTGEEKCLVDNAVNSQLIAQTQGHTQCSPRLLNIPRTSQLCRFPLCPCTFASQVLSSGHQSITIPARPLSRCVCVQDCS